MLSILLADNPGIKRDFEQVGMTIANGQFYAVDPQTGMIKAGAGNANYAAYQMIKNNYLQENAELISFFIEMGEAEATRQEVMDAQFKTVMTGHVGNVPDFVYDKKAKKYNDNWTNESASLVAHLSHWLPGGAWGYQYNHNFYRESKGGTLKVLIAYCLAQSEQSKRLEAMKKKAKTTREKNSYEKAKIVIENPNGSYEWIPTTYTPTWGGHIEKFSGGVGLREIKKACPKPIEISESVRRTDKYYKDHLFISDKAGKYYIIPINGQKFTPKPNEKH